LAETPAKRGNLLTLFHNDSTLWKSPLLPAPEGSPNIAERKWAINKWTEKTPILSLFLPLAKDSFCSVCNENREKLWNFREAYWNIVAINEGK
jgi:hypothetical protein